MTFLESMQGEDSGILSSDTPPLWEPHNIALNWTVTLFETQDDIKLPVAEFRIF